MSVSDESVTLSNASKEEIAREIKEIFSYVKSSNRDNNVLANACRRLKNKSEAGYRGLLRLLNKCGYINVILEITKNIQKNENEVSGDNWSTISFGTESLSMSNRDVELETISTTTNELPSTSHNYSTDDAGENVGGRRNSMTADGGCSKSERYARTKYILSKTGLLGIADKTKELLKKNKQLQKDLDSLKQETEAFLQCVLNNPQNQGLVVKQKQVLQGTLDISTASSAPMMSVNTSTTSMASMDTSDFAGILSGIYDIELPSVILAPLPVDPIFACPEPIVSAPSDNIANQFGMNSTPPSPPRKRMKRNTN